MRDGSGQKTKRPPRRPIFLARPVFAASPGSSVIGSVPVKKLMIISRMVHHPFIKCRFCFYGYTIAAQAPESIGRIHDCLCIRLVFQEKAETTAERRLIFSAMKSRFSGIIGQELLKKKTYWGNIQW